MPQTLPRRSTRRRPVPSCCLRPPPLASRLPPLASRRSPFAARRSPPAFRRSPLAARRVTSLYGHPSHSHIRSLLSSSTILPLSLPISLSLSLPLSSSHVSHLLSLPIIARVWALWPLSLSFMASFVSWVLLPFGFCCPQLWALRPLAARVACVAHVGSVGRLSVAIIAVPL